MVEDELYGIRANMKEGTLLGIRPIQKFFFPFRINVIDNNILLFPCNGECQSAFLHRRDFQHVIDGTGDRLIFRVQNSFLFTDEMQQLALAS